MQKVLSALKDIPGVVGSFVHSDGGTLLCREMPAIYPDAMFPELGRRLASVKEAAEAHGPDSSEVILKFESFWLVSRRTPQCTLSVLTADTVNYPALRMATNMALRQLEAKIEAGAGAAETEAAPVDKPKRFFRGRAIG